MESGGPVLICYDGSEDSTAAIQAVAPLFPGRTAVVACFWQPFSQFARRFAVSLLQVVQEASEINEREAALSQQIAEHGAAVAAASGLSAEGRAIGVSRPIDESIIVHADEIDASLIVVGSRGRSGIGS